MKKWILAAVLILTGAKQLYALPLGNPFEPAFLSNGVFWGGACPDYRDPCNLWVDTWSVRFGYYGDFVYDRRLRIKGAGFNKGKNIHESQISTNAGYGVINIGNRLDVFGTAGISRITISQNETSWNPSLTANLDGQLQTNSSFSWSVGARAALIRWGGFTFGAEGQYFQSKLDFNRYTTGFGSVIYFNDGNKTKYREWQAGIGLAYSITCCDPQWQVIPYAGLKWAWVRLSTNDFSFVTFSEPVIGTRTLTIFDLNEQRHFGYALGVTLTAWGNAAFTVEGRWSSEKALYFNTQFRF